MTTTDAPVHPYAAGAAATVVVGLQGTVTAVGDRTVSIDGVTVPISATGPVRYVSDLIPDGEYDDDAYDPEDDPRVAQINVLLDAIARLHEENHPGVLSLCLHDVCRRWGR